MLESHWLILFFLFPLSRSRSDCFGLFWSLWNRKSV